MARALVAHATRGSTAAVPARVGQPLWAQAKRTKDAAAACAAISPLNEAFLTGRVEPARLSLVERLARSPRGDTRDWSPIEAETDAVAPRLVPI